MEENNIKDHLPTSDESKRKLKKSFSEQITLWVGIAGTVITLFLTAWNTHTKTLIDKREEDLKTLELKLKDRVTGVEESKERVDRYKWVFSLYPVLSGKDDMEKNFTINLIRLALTKDEAEQLFTGLQASSDTAMQAVGQSGIKSIQNEPIAILVSQMNANTPEERKRAVTTLVNDYKSSSMAITFVLRMYDQDVIRNLSPSGIINGLYYLGNTDPGSWNKQQVEAAKQVILRMEARNPGSQTRVLLDNFSSFMNKAESNH